MAVKVQTSDGRASLDDLRMLIFGAPGIGKTTLGSAWPDAIFLMTDPKGKGTLKGLRWVHVKDWKTFADAVDAIVSREIKCRTVIVDTIEDVHKFVTTYVLKKHKVDHQSDVKYGKAYDEIDAMYSQAVGKLFAMNIAVILLSHTRQQTIRNGPSETMRNIPMLKERARAAVIPYITLIGYADIETRKIKEGGKVEYKDVRVLQFEPTETIEAKNRDGIMPDKIRLWRDPKKTYQVFVDAYHGKLKKGDS